MKLLESKNLNGTISNQTLVELNDLIKKQLKPKADSIGENCRILFQVSVYFK